MNCAICGNKLKIFRSYKVNKVRLDYIRRICIDCVKKLGITKIDSETKQSLLLSHIEDLKRLIENKEKFSTRIQLERASVEKENEIQIKNEQEEKFKDVKNEFTIHGSIYSNVFLRDDNKQILLTKNNQNWYKIFKYSELETFERNIDEDVSYKTNKKHGITRAIAGNAIAGPVGAIIGSGTAKSNSVENHRIKSITFSIRFTSGYLYTIIFSGIDSQIKIADSLYLHLNGIISSNQRDNKKTIMSNNNELNNLTKLKELLDDGVITEEEFTAKKKQILGI
ncbi:hypothetical protein R53718_MFFEMHAI_00742 [Fructobacillus evanidus]|uniref:SHOCT domain-containing protein n=1 Tax=Fructobacillus evanidus TaxID=3064281 RepID=UPI002DAA623E|nr:hypothetical protein R53718_MFFEMHAI_00742 [Fructobacillus sp. LMG 32999]